MDMNRFQPTLYDRFPFSYSDPNYVSPWSKEEMEVEREIEDESTHEPEPSALERKGG